MQRVDRPVDGEVGADRPVLDHRQHQRCGADLEVGRDLGQVGVADDDVQPTVLLGVGMRLVTGVDDRPLQRRLETDLDLEVVGPLADLEARRAPVLADADPAGAAHDLAADEERREVPDDVGERRRPLHQVVLVGAVGRALVVGVVLVQHERVLPGDVDCSRRRDDDCSPALSHTHDVARVGALGCRVLRVGVVDVQPGAVGQDQVGEADVLVGQLARVGDRAAEVEAARVAQRALLLEVPPGASRARAQRGIGVDELRRREHRVGRRRAEHRDAELSLGAHDAPNGHACSLRWPLLSLSQRGVCLL